MPRTSASVGAIVPSSSVVLVTAVLRPEERLEATDAMATTATIGAHRSPRQARQPTAPGGALADVGAITHALEHSTNNYLGPSQAIAPLELWQKDASIPPTPLCAASGNARRDQGLCCPACSPFLGALFHGTSGPAQGMQLNRNDRPLGTCHRCVQRSLLVLVIKVIELQP